MTQLDPKAVPKKDTQAQNKTFSWLGPNASFFISPALQRLLLPSFVAKLFAFILGLRANREMLRGLETGLEKNSDMTYIFCWNKRLLFGIIHQHKIS